MIAPSLATGDGQGGEGRAYTVVWRLHFYAGLVSVPFVLWLAVTGALYLFQPQLDALIDRRYDMLEMRGSAAAPSAQVAAALATVDGLVLNAYELPAGPRSASRVLIGRGSDLYRVYVHPPTLKILKVVPENERLTRLLFYLHGELLLGWPGSMLVELAASWTIMLILTGWYLWWPRDGRGAGGILYPRFSARGRPLWRDLHAVFGFWVSFCTLFLLVSGLPWASSWGGMLKAVRQIGSETVVRQPWTTGSESEAAERVEAHDQHRPAVGGGRGSTMSGTLYGELDRLVPIVAPLGFAPPVLISPPSALSPTWTARSEARNRPLRQSVTLDGSTGAVTSRTTFAEWPLIDQLVGYGVAIHEGHLFGWFNQALGVFTAVGLVVVSVSGVMMWWKRRPAHRLGAPMPRRRLITLPALWGGLVILGVALPLLGASLVLVLALDRWVLPLFPDLAFYLGARSARG
ncbi:Uncharacterized iron-regulated membrane protein [Enhydrobacter aerosaccus]|uniref:Uncharacterized iron-regulated membrane protein n=1 Tax=Enhydrobacter aerosaccus TaxID=225324 RepID=A0A1T4NNW3_9HYPH|nr:PepSY domain-containing protein [Enhydrobacter aerosaccus]SJZ80777.1 Uncharacterized iron-regulated membrane protein [Enhydrobacter aerosaccus]